MILSLFFSPFSVLLVSPVSQTQLEAREQGSYVMQPLESASAAAAAAAAKSHQSCPTLRDPIDSSPPGSLPLGFSRHEHSSGLPFPSPMHESEK